MRIPKKVFAEQFGYEKDEINDTNVTDTIKCESDVFLESNNFFTNQPRFQCTSLEKDEALNFAKPSTKEENQEDFVSVLLKIELKSNKNFFIYDKNTHAFPHEREVLLQEGLEFKILEKSKKRH